MTAPESSAGTRALAWSLVVLAFLSKTSLSFTGLMPSALGFLIFQGGLHPYGNMVLNLVLGSLLLFRVARRGEWPTLAAYHPAFRAFAVGTVLLLWVQHLLQLAIGVETNAPLLLATLLATTFLILAFGLLIPWLLPLRAFVNGVSRTCFLLCAASLVLLLIGAPSLYKGGRFIGLMKHIPYMVTCATVGFFFTLGRWRESYSIRRQLAFLGAALVFLACLWLTGTRSSLLAVLAGLPLYFLAYRSRHWRFRAARALITCLGMLACLLFGSAALDFASDVATGKRGLGQREAQDGVGDRMEEISRGLEMVKQSPYVGLGLLSKFRSDDAEDVAESYNSLQDPHNLFVSSAVVAGWPFAVWVALGFLALSVGAVALLRRGSPPGLAIAVYLLSHLPILAIYHMHLSLGGLADRIYWLSFGYLGLLLGSGKTPQKEEN